MGSDARQLLSDLSSGDEAAWKKAQLVLGGCGRTNGDWVPDLAVAVAEGDRDTRFWAATALGRIGGDAAASAGALIDMLGDSAIANRQVAASALAKLGRRAASRSVPALTALLDSEESSNVRVAAVEALRRLVRHDSAALVPIMAALDDPAVEVRSAGVIALKCLGYLAADALAILRRVVDDAGEAAGVRSQAKSAVELILRGSPELRLDEPYQALNQAAGCGRFGRADMADLVRAKCDADDYLGALDLLDGGSEAEQDALFWVWMLTASRELGDRRETTYSERYNEVSGVGGFFEELRSVVRSSRTVAEEMARMVGFCANATPDPDWQLFNDIDYERDLIHLRSWLENAREQRPFPIEMTGLWFGIVDLVHGETSRSDLYVAGGPHDIDYERVLGFSWEPPHQFANSMALAEISRIAGSHSDGGCDHAEYRLCLTYAALAVRWLATTLGAGVLLGNATERVLSTGFDDGDCLVVGTLTQQGLVFPTEGNDPT